MTPCFLEVKMIVKTTQIVTMELEARKKKIIEKMLMSDDQRNVQIAKCMLRAASYTDTDINEWRSELLAAKSRSHYKSVTGLNVTDRSGRPVIYVGTSGMEMYNSMMKKLFIEPNQTKGYFLPVQFTKAQWTEDD